MRTDQTVEERWEPRGVAPGLWERHLWRVLKSEKRFVLAMGHKAVIGEDKLVGKQERPRRANAWNDEELGKRAALHKPHCSHPPEASKAGCPERVHSHGEEQKTQEVISVTSPLAA